MFPSDTALQKTGLSCIPQYMEEVDHATCQLGYHFTTTRHKVWRPVLIIVIYARRDGWSRPLALAVPQPMSFLERNNA